jgi:4'-phosphopantetheinyl transferase EntD
MTELPSPAIPSHQNTGTLADPALALAIQSFRLPGLLMAHRLIAPGDELALLDDEKPGFAGATPGVRRASGAARIVARHLLSALGHAACAVPKAPSGAALWPAGITGSIAHDDRIAVVALGRARDLGAIGVDIEPARPLPLEMLELVATARERRGIGDDLLQAKLLFACKEAVFLEFHDIEVDLKAGAAAVPSGRAVALQTSLSTHILVLASCNASR